MWRTAESDDLEAALARLDAEIAEARVARSSLAVEAHAAGRFRAEFVAAVRHELKTPLNAILGFTGVLLEEIDGPLSESQREDLEAMRGAGLHLRALVEAVLEEAAPEAGLTPVEIEPLLQEVAGWLRARAAGRSISREVRVEVEVEAGLPAIVADRSRLLQVLMNLGTNALRVMERGRIRLEGRTDAEGVRLSVVDTGPGIAPEELPRLFAPFEQGEAGPGSAGLGLAICRELLSWHGGRLEVESTPGEGSAFHACLPLDRP